MQFTTPHSNTLALAIQGKDVVIPSIILLNCICSPKAVVRGIVTAIVTTLNTVFGGRAFTHILQEKGEVIPSGANRDSASTVPIIRSVIRVVASSSHPLPYDIFGRFQSKAVSAVNRTYLLFTQTSTTLNHILFEMKARGFRGVSALATTQPVDTFTSFFRYSDDGKTIKNKTSKINKIMSVFHKYIVAQFADILSNTTILRGSTLILTKMN